MREEDDIALRTRLRFMDDSDVKHIAITAIAEWNRRSKQEVVLLSRKEYDDLRKNTVFSTYKWSGELLARYRDNAVLSELMERLK